MSQIVLVPKAIAHTVWGAQPLFQTRVVVMLLLVSSAFLSWWVGLRLFLSPRYPVVKFMVSASAGIWTAEDKVRTLFGPQILLSTV